jgi:hypothetical protein
VRNEFRQRNRLTQALVWICLDHPVLSRLIENLLKQFADRLTRLGNGRMTQFCYSAIFNLRYYQGVADELGGYRRLFSKQVAQDHTPMSLH